MTGLRFFLVLWPSLWHTSAGFAPLNRHLGIGLPSVLSKSGRSRSVVAYYQNATDPPSIAKTLPVHRFHREASNVVEIQEECIISIHEKKYNLTAWANAHPGGAKILQKFHDRDASKAFEAAHHSAAAYEMLKDFEIVDESSSMSTTGSISNPKSNIPQNHNSRSRVRRKLFTKEDPIGFHKYLGIFCLLNFIGRFSQMYFGDPAAGLGSRGYKYFSMGCLLPHMLLSLSSLIFHTVPRERVVGKPMIWKEYRIHNIIFGVRSVITAFVASLAIRMGNTPTIRRFAVGVSCACILVANAGADIATSKLRAVEVESTTATMPYWEGCSLKTQKKFKSFYAYCQFMASLACLSVSNPAWPLCVLLAIQMASLLMTLVRKGLLSAKGYHYGYTMALLAPFFVGFRDMAIMKTPDFLGMLLLGYGMYQARRRGVNKYALWVPVVGARFAFGDALINYKIW